MDSYLMYREICEYVSKNPYDSAIITSKARDLIVCIANELMKFPYSLGNSKFIAEMLKVLPNADGLISIDAYAIILDTERYIKTGTFGGYHQMRIRKQELFCRIGSREDWILQQIKGSLEGIKAYLSLLKKKSFPVSEVRVIDTAAAPRMQPQVSANAGSEQPQRAGTQTFEQQRAEQIRRIEQQKAEQQKLEQQRAERESIRRRLEDNRRSITEWHENQKSIAGEIAKIQPGVNTILSEISSIHKGFVSLSDRIVEECVRQFAERYIYLFNFISDNLDSHREKAERSGNNDYYNAVMNYEDFRGMIIDDLAALGVEEIKTEPGGKFDGKIHEAANTSRFTPSLAVVKKSVRSGFRYKEIVFQREKVNV